jgi:hypothetical protein
VDPGAGIAAAVARVDPGIGDPGVPSASRPGAVRSRVRRSIVVAESIDFTHRVGGVHPRHVTMVAVGIAMTTKPVA